MPLPDDASLFIPYTVEALAGSFVAVQKQGDDIVFLSSVTWPTQADAERHAHDLNWLREKAVQKVPASTVWVAIDIAAEGPDGMLILERTLVGEGVLGWRLLNPAADDDNDAWESARHAVQNALDALTQEELPEDDETLEEHLIDRHGFDPNTVHSFGPLSDAWFVRHHRELHTHPGPDGSLDHTHEWTDEEVEDDAPSDEEEGTHEDQAGG